jgi:hypothetical protein
VNNTDIKLKGYFSDIRLRRRSDGKERPLFDRIDNLITDIGLDQPATCSWWGCFSYLMLGTGSTPATFADTALEAKIGATNTYSGTENGYDYTNSTKKVRYWTTFVYYGSDTDPITFREMGVSPDGTLAFNRIVLAADATIPTGYDLIAKYTLELTFPFFRTAVAHTISIAGVSVPGKKMACDYGEDNAFPGSGMLYRERVTDPSHVTSYPYLLEGKESLGGITINCCRVLTSSVDLSSVQRVTGLPTGVARYTHATEDYVAGNHYLDRVFTIPASDYPAATLHGFYIASYEGFSSPSAAVFAFDAGVTKPATDSWTITNRLSWGRA